jgi:hypothetical protein
VIESGVFGCDAYCRIGPSTHVKLPRELGELFLELPEVGGLESRKAHEDSVCGPKPEVGKVTTLETSAEFNAALLNC